MKFTLGWKGPKAIQPQNIKPANIRITHMKNLAILGVAAFRVSKRICRNIPRNYYPEQRNVALFCQLIKQNAQFWAKILKNDCKYMNTIYFNCILKVKIRVIFTVMNTTYFSNSKNQACEKFRPVQELNPWTLQNRCSALPSELKKSKVVANSIITFFNVLYFHIATILIIIMIIFFNQY